MEGWTTVLTARETEVEKIVLLLHTQVKWEAISGFDNVEEHIDPWTKYTNGFRIFPGYKNPNETNNIQNKLKLTVHGGLEGVSVNIRVYDIDDSTSESFDHDIDTGIRVIDVLGAPGNDNKFGPYSIPLEGQFYENNAWGDSFVSGVFDENGEFSRDFRVGMQPGNNYRAAVFIGGIPDEAINNPIQVDSPTAPNYIGYKPNENGTIAIASPPLTVWRKLWVENDSMEGIPVDADGFKENYVGGTGIILDAILLPNGNTQLKLDTNGLPANADDQNLEHGEIQIGAVRYSLLTFFITASSGTNAQIAGNHVAFKGAKYALYDDDDFGLANAPLPKLDIVNTTLKNVYKPAFIQVVDAYNYNPRKIITFYRLHAAVVGIVPPLFGGNPGVYDDAIDLTSTNGLWVGNLIAGYQSEFDSDGDPDSEGSDEGGTPQNTRKYSVVFVEAIRDAQESLFRNPNYPNTEAESFVNKNISLTAAHELGHMLGGGDAESHHSEAGMMESGGYSDSDKFGPATIRRFRRTLNWQQPN